MDQSGRLANGCIHTEIQTTLIVWLVTFATNETNASVVPDIISIWNRIGNWPKYL
jgi:hypothetical protein